MVRPAAPIWKAILSDQKKKMALGQLSSSIIQRQIPIVALKERAFEAK